MKTKHELMADLIDKADKICLELEVFHDGFTVSRWQYFTALKKEYTRLRAELAEVKYGSAEAFLSELKTVRDEFVQSVQKQDWDHDLRLKSENLIILVDQFGDILSQSPKMPTEEVKKIIDETTEAHPYRQVGKPETYSDYNQGWEDACDILGNRIMELLTP